MELAELAQKQKRLIALIALCEEEVKNEELHVKFVDTLKCYRNLLARVWEHNEINSADEQQIEDLERRLERLSSQARSYPAAGKF